MVYEDLFMMGLSTRNAEKVIRLVLEKVPGRKIARLTSDFEYLRVLKFIC